MGVEERKPGQDGLSPGWATVYGTVASVVTPASSLSLFTCRMGMKMVPTPPECSGEKGNEADFRGSSLILTPRKYPWRAQGLAIVMLFSVALFMISQLGNHLRVQ